MTCAACVEVGLGGCSTREHTCGVPPLIVEITAKPAAIPGLTCQVCGAPAVGVFSSGLGPASFAYCAECGAVGAEPYGLTVAYVALCCGTTPDAVEEWFHGLIEATCGRAGKTVEQFWADVKTEAAKPMETT